MSAYMIGCFFYKYTKYLLQTQDSSVKEYFRKFKVDVVYYSKATSSQEYEEIL